MKLTDEQVAQYQRDGMVIVERFFSDREIQAMRMELARFQREGLIRNVATVGDGKTVSSQAANLQVIPLDNKSGLFRAVSFRDEVVDAIGRLIGNPFSRQLDQIFLKPGRHGAGTSWHQDNAYFKIADPTQGVGMWISLHDASLANGTMELIPGSHKQALPHERDPGSNHHIRCVVDESKSVPVIVKAGGVAFFNWGIAHCTRGNNTDHERAGAAYHYIRNDAIPEGDKRWTIIPVTGPTATGGEKEYGKRIAGTWKQEVDRVLAGTPRLSEACQTA